MSSFPPPDVSDPMQHEEISAGGRGAGWFLIVMHLAVGGVTLALAISPEFASGRAAFADDVWRILFGVVGGLLTFVAIRGISRSQTQGERLTPERRRRAKVVGVVLIAIGGVFFSLGVSRSLGEQVILFESWAKPFYITAGIYLFLVGLGLQWNPTRALRQQRVQQGQGRHGTARILRANDTGLTVNDDPQVKIEFDITVDGQVHQASDKIVMDRAKLALLIPGSTMDVLVDLIDPTVFHLDWDSWRPPESMQGSSTPTAPTTRYS